MPKYIVVHGSVSKVPVGGKVEMSAEEAEHINSSGQMLCLEGETPELVKTRQISPEEQLAAVDAAKHKAVKAKIAAEKAKAKAAPAKTEGK